MKSISSVKDLSIRVIEWKFKQGDRRVHFGGESGVVLSSQPGNVTAPGFDFSRYAYAPFFQKIANANLLELEGLNEPDFAPCSNTSGKGSQTTFVGGNLNKPPNSSTI